MIAQLMSLRDDDPEKYEELKEKLRLKCEENNALPEQLLLEGDAEKQEGNGGA